MTLIGVSVAIYVLTQVRNWLWDYWNTRKPHVERKLKAEAERDEAASKLFDTLRESEGTKNQILETLSAVQQAHASDCRTTAVKVDEIHRVVVQRREAT
jgi:hypothetical protein